MTDPRSTYDIEVHDLGSADAELTAPLAPDAAPSWATGTAWGAPESVGNWETMPPPAIPLAPTPIDAAQRQRRRWSWLIPRTLVTRLVAGVVLLVIVVVTISGYATSTLLHQFLYQRLDQQIVPAGNQIDYRYFLGPVSSPRVPHSSAQLYATGLFGSQAVDANSATGSAFVGSFRVSDSVERKLVARTSTQPTTITTTTGLGLRVVVHQYSGLTLTSSSGTTTNGTLTVIVGTPTAEVDNTLHRLLILELVIGGSAVVIAFILSAYGVRLSLRQLNRVTSTAREVTAELASEGGGLDRRVQVTEPDTEVGQLAESVNTLLETVESEFAARVESEDRMRQFLADASHELRTPLTSIRGYAELARMRRQSGGDGSEDADTLDRIESEGTRMSRLVEDLLTLARSDRGSEPVFELVDVDELVDDAARGARAAFPQRRIDVAVTPGLTVQGDHDQLLRVLRNLVNNAAVHTRPDGAIRVRADREGNEIVLRVDDEGPGLSEEEAAHVFERFWRADKARTRAKGGSGLGLSIVTSIVADHGGTVSFDSSLQTGSTVTIRLPAPMLTAEQ